jgi:Haem-binding domain
MTRTAKVAVALGSAVVLMQVFRPDYTNPPVEGDIAAPPEVASILRRACYDCHSNETTWPWYSQLAPVSWLVARDVTQGRRELNFSMWQGYPAKRKAKKLEEIASEVQEGEMPMAIYVPLHPQAKLSDADKAALVSWAKTSDVTP